MKKHRLSYLWVVHFPWYFDYKFKGQLIHIRTYTWVYTARNLIRTLQQQWTYWLAGYYPPIIALLWLVYGVKMVRSISQNSLQALFSCLLWIGPNLVKQEQVLTLLLVGLHKLNKLFFLNATHTSRVWEVLLSSMTLVFLVKGSS